MLLRKCHKCGYAMIPQNRVTYNYLFSSLDCRCLKCQAKVQVPENFSTGLLFVIGLGCIVIGDTVYVALGVLMIVAPFWRRLRNPALSREALAALGLSELTPSDIEPQCQPARSPRAEQPAKGDWTSRAEQQFSIQPKEQAPPAAGRSRIQPPATPRGFGRRVTR